MSDVKLTNEVIGPKDKRDSLVDKVEVLSKVKELLLPPELEMATLQQVADFYNVPKNMITNLFRLHEDELVSDGYTQMKGNDLVSFFSTEAKRKRRGSYTVTSRSGEEYTYSNYKNGLFPKEAILRVGILLRDSEVAKEVRAQLLNTEEEKAAQSVATNLPALGNTFDNSEFESKQDRSQTLEGNFYSSITKSYVNGLILCGLSFSLLLIKLPVISSK
ncbi:MULTISPECIES: hypothetical protein [Bacillus]|uniref:hypothetical protein n=1 Tax=Bacillus TaxID=1386 RepID=UPI001E295C4E|nr:MULTISPECIES: hypothetical protein [Bacillus cereus group]MCC2425241.1 hypothetical protein [Bacillus wiedmannii]MDA2631008.1 hypothetical protein [Bacillus cereus]MDX6047587.1 hypothetical protein [Bacillus paranthracis]UQM92570.1 hypothetical protein SY563_000139 [Bacillus thuringiensis]WAI17409.1 hypothetical protein OU819_27655 [Bacillus cereus]